MTQRTSLRFAVAAAVLATAAPGLQAQAAVAPCASTPLFAALDFWVGDWTVWVGEQQAGTNRIAKVLDGCAITEEWVATGGGEGRSLFYVPPGAGHWQQVWVTGNALAPGGTKEKTQLRDPLPDGAIRFQGTIRNGGREWLDRTTLTPHADGTVRQQIEISVDGGATWRTTFDAVYRKASLDAPGPADGSELAAAAVAQVVRADSLARDGRLDDAIVALERFSRTMSTPPLRDLAHGNLEAANGEALVLGQLAVLRATDGDTAGAMAALDRLMLVGVHENLADTLADADGWRPLAQVAGAAGRLAALRAREAMWSNDAFRFPWSDSLPLEQRLAGLALAWAEVRYGFVGMGDPPVAWDSLFIASIPLVIDAPATSDYYRVLEAMVSRLHDDHTDIALPRELRSDRVGAPLVIRQVEGRVAVVDVRSPTLTEAGWRIGDEIIAVEGMAPEVFVRDSIAPWATNSTPQASRSEQFGWRLLTGPRDSERRLTVRRADGATEVRRVRRGGWTDAVATPDLEVRRLDGDIGYLAPNSFTASGIGARIDSALDALKGVRGLVVDLRGNTGGAQNPGWRIIARLIDRPVIFTEQYSAGYIPILRAWGLGMPAVPMPARTIIPHDDAPWRIPVAWLIGPRTASAAEGVTAAAIQAGVVHTFGEATFGSTGQPLLVPLPGGGQLRVRVEEERMQDGSRYIGRGIAPMTIAPITIESLRSGRDPALEAGLAWLAEQRQEGGR